MKSTTPASPPLTDGFGRVHNSLRISVTDRCNIRCFYCMPAGDVEFRPHAEILTFEEIASVVRTGVRLGIDRLRLTGGEPLVRRDLPVLVRMLRSIEGITDIGLTTNGVLLDKLAEPLRDAGLQRLNISLDTLDPESFRRITRRDVFADVIRGIEAARHAGFSPIKLNAVSIRGVTEDQVIPFGRLARETDTEVRFIEYMPLDADSQWERGRVLFADEILKMLAEHFGPLDPAEAPRPNAPAAAWRFRDGVGRIGVIASVSRPFCSQCNRFRLTADGKLRNCLFSLEETDIRPLLRSPECADEASRDQAIGEAMVDCIRRKKAGHQINSDTFVQPDRPMYSIGG